MAFIQLAIVSCDSGSKKSVDSIDAADSSMVLTDSAAFEQKLQGRVFDLEIVKQKTVELRKLNPGIRLATILQGYPEEGSPYYQVEFAEMQDTHKTNIYWFYIDEKTSEIFLQDTGSGKLIPIGSEQQK